MEECQEKHCEDCKYFRQHYVKAGRGYAWADCGHCVHPRLKERKPDTKACQRFAKK